MAAITLLVNGKRHTVEVEPSTPLLYVLRNDLDLSGPRFGCGLGQCGACTVLIRGEAVRSCVRPVSQAQNVEITTLEGLVEGRPAASDSAGLDRRAGAGVRLLPERPDPHRQGAARQDAESDRRADSRRHEERALPLHDLLPHQRGREARRAEDGVMAAKPPVARFSRRPGCWSRRSPPISVEGVEAFLQRRPRRQRDRIPISISCSSTRGS